MSNKRAKAVVATGGGKNPKSRSLPEMSKVPRTVYVDDAMKMNPAWRITLVQTAEPWGWHTLTGTELQEVHSKLCEYETKTWSEILVQEQYRNHRVEFHRLCKEAQDRLTELNLDDLEQLVSLRLGAKERVWGILDHNIMHLIWWDPDHQICPSLKKHT
jgi:hypothetical protein